MFPNVEVRHLHAAIVLAEELNFTRAAQRLYICQPALTKQIAELEKELGFQLFVRDHKKITDLTEPGRVFVEEARSAVLHAERAVHLARSVNLGSETVLTVGHSPYADRSWISTLLALRLPLYPNLHPRLEEPLRDGVGAWRDFWRAGLSNRHRSTERPEDHGGGVRSQPPYVALPENHRAAHKEALKLEDLDKNIWGLFTTQANPLAHDAIMHLASKEQLVPNEIHEVLSASDAFYVVTELGGVAFVSKATALNTQIDGIVFKPLSDESLWFDTCLVMKAEEKSRVVNQFGREFLRKYSLRHPSASQMALGEIA